MKKSKKAKKAKAKKVKAKPRAQKVTSQELVIRVAPQAVVPSETDLAEPMTEVKGKQVKLTIPKTWVSEGQLTKILQKTPANHVYQKPGKGGGKFDYVTTSYIIKALNYIFGWDWDFEVLEHGIEGGQVWAKGKLTCRGSKPGQAIVKTQFGRADIKYKKQSKDMLDFGNDLKGASSDALKKCASLLGIASDIYGKSDYKEESGVTPRPNPEPAQEYDQRPPEERVSAAVTAVKEKHGAQSAPVEATEKCVGISGKGCAYGNDFEPLSPEVAAYSKRMYKKPLCRECQKDAKK